MTKSGNTPLSSKARAVRPANLIERRMTKFMREPPSVRLAASVIVTATTFIVVAGGVLMRVFDHSEYSSVWLGMWWILQTVTTVGYGDYVPNNTVGKLITAFVMLEGIAFLSIVTAGITSVFVARAERERTLDQDDASDDAQAAVSERLDRVDAQLAQLTDSIARLDALLRTDPGTTASPR
jgi:voltage-gated potassium channel Kch